MKILDRSTSLLFALLLLLAALLACKSSASSAPISISADDLFKEYQADEGASDRKYKGKTLIVSGTVGKTAGKTNEVMFVGKGDRVIVWGLRFAPDQAEAISKLKDGDQVNVRGTCDGRAKMLGVSVNQVSIIDSVLQ
jgi:hypothetical protein